MSDGYTGNSDKETVLPTTANTATTMKLNELFEIDTDDVLEACKTDNRGWVALGP